MAETLLLLVTAHLLADFVLQPDWMVERKREWPILLLHVVFVGGLAAALLGGLPLRLLALVTVTHGIMDAIKVRMSPPRWTEIGAFSIDQAVHVAVLVLAAAWFPTAAEDGLWLAALPSEIEATFLRFGTLVAGLVVGVAAGQGVVDMMLRLILPDRPEDGGESGEGAEGDDDGLPRGGRWIGALERLLVMILVIAGEIGAVGFVVAAKSILRFGEADQRRVVEYIIIGTFLSFIWALAAAFATVALLARW